MFDNEVLNNFLGILICIGPFLAVLAPVHIGWVTVRYLRGKTVQRNTIVTAVFSACIVLTSIVSYFLAPTPPTVQTDHVPFASAAFAVTYGVKLIIYWHLVAVVITSLGFIRLVLFCCSRIHDRRVLARRAGE